MDVIQPVKGSVAPCIKYCVCEDWIFYPLSVLPTLRIVPLNHVSPTNSSTEPQEFSMRSLEYEADDDASPELIGLAAYGPSESPLPVVDYDPERKLVGPYPIISCEFLVPIMV